MASTAPKSHQCPDCDKSFTRAFNLKMHMNTHSGERPFQCNVCGDTFIRNHDLKMHARRHTGEKPYRCDECSKTFTRTSALKFHRENICKPGPASASEEMQPGSSLGQSVEANPYVGDSFAPPISSVPFGEEGISGLQISDYHGPHQVGHHQYADWMGTAESQAAILDAVPKGNLAALVAKHHPSNPENVCTKWWEGEIAEHRKQSQVSQTSSEMASGTVTSLSDPTELETSVAVQDLTVWFQLVRKGRYSQAWYQNAWLTAARYGKMFILRFLLESNLVDINIKGGLSGSTALHLTAQDSRRTATDYLLRAGAEVNMQDDSGLTPLHCALSLKGQRQLQIIEALLAAGADVDIKNMDGEAPLHYAVRYQNNDPPHLACIRSMIEKSCDVRQKTPSGTLLHYAVTHCTVPVLRILLEYDIDVNDQDEQGVAPLHLACQLGKEGQVAELLRNAPSLSLIDNHGRTGFHYVFCKMLSPNPDVDFTNQISAVINVLQRHGGDVNARDNLGATALHHHLDRVPASRYPAKQVVQALIHAGADLKVLNLWNERVQVALGLCGHYILPDGPPGGNGKGQWQPRAR